MGTCHNIIEFENKLMGDVLEIEMLKSSFY